MNQPPCTDTDYIDFLVATPRAVRCVEAARVQPRRADAAAHDAVTRLLHRLEPDPAALWQEGAPLVERTTGILVGDDSTLDKPYAAKMARVTRHWSSKHHAVVDRIILITLVWADGDRIIPMDYRVYDKTRDGITKNAHLLAMLLTRMPSSSDGHRVGHSEGRDHSPCGTLLSRSSIVYPPRICVSPTTEMVQIMLLSHWYAILHTRYTASSRVTIRMKEQE